MPLKYKDSKTGFNSPKANILINQSLESKHKYIDAFLILCYSSKNACNDNHQLDSY